MLKRGAASAAPHREAELMLIKKSRAGERERETEGGQLEILSAPRKVGRVSAILRAIVGGMHYLKLTPLDEVLARARASALFFFRAPTVKTKCLRCAESRNESFRRFGRARGN